MLRAKCHKVPHLGLELVTLVKVGVGGEPDMVGKNCAPLGNVLVIQEEDTEQPNDNANGSTITLKFDSEVD
jgi:hypothetical protein